MAETMPKTGDSMVTTEPENLNGKGSQGSNTDDESVVLSPRLLSYKAATVYLSVGYSTVRHMVLSGMVPHVRSGRRILIDVQDLDKWIEKSKETGV